MHLLIELQMTEVHGAGVKNIKMLTFIRVCKQSDNCQLLFEVPCSHF